MEAEGSMHMDAEVVPPVLATGTSFDPPAVRAENAIPPCGDPSCPICLPDGRPA
jgi:hypothetical protein